MTYNTIIYPALDPATTTPPAERVRIALLVETLILPDPELRIRLDALLTAPDPRPALHLLMASPLGAALLPEVVALDMDQGGGRLHKDNLTHSITVAYQAPPRLRLRWAALLHDIGKPPTRKIEGTKVTFYNHEQVGRSMARALLTRLGYDAQFTKDVAQLVEISGRTHGFDETWTDSALRRFITDAGPLVDDALDLSRADCTSARPGRRAEVSAQVDAVAARITAVRAADAAAALRPALTGDQIMETLDLAPGPRVGQAYRYLLDIARSGTELTEAEAVSTLRSWAATQ